MPVGSPEPMVGAALDGEGAANPWTDVPSHPPTAVEPSTLDDLDPFAPVRPASTTAAAGEVEKPEASAEAIAVKPEMSAAPPALTPANAQPAEPTPSSLPFNPFDTIKSVFSRSSSSTPVSSGSPPGTPTRPTSGGGLLQAIVGTAMGRDPASRPAAAVESQAPAFDFGRFQAQMRSREAEPVVKYLRSFLQQFSRRTWPVKDQIRLINDFLDFAADKMRQCQVWAQLSDQAFDNAVEGMEKLVMNRLYDQTFTPALSLEARATNTTDDLERDHVLHERIRLFSWIREEHLDLPPMPDSAAHLQLACDELSRVNAYKSPRDKLLNACKILFGLIRRLHSDQGADTFLPLLVFTLLRSNPDHLVSNLEYIRRFRNPERLQGEPSYYLASMSAALSFIEALDHSSLSQLTLAANITKDEFEHQLEQAVAMMPEPSPNPNAVAARQASATRDTPVSASVDPHDADASALNASTPSPVGLFERSTQAASRPLAAIQRAFADLSVGDPVAASPTSPRRRRGYSGHSDDARPPVGGSSGDWLPDSASAADVQAEIDARAAAETEAALGTLRTLFPTMENGVLEVVLISCGGDLARAVDSLLEMS